MMRRCWLPLVRLLKAETSLFLIARSHYVILRSLTCLAGGPGWSRATTLLHRIRLQMQTSLTLASLQQRFFGGSRESLPIVSEWALAPILCFWRYYFQFVDFAHFYTDKWNLQIRLSRTTNTCCLSDGSAHRFSCTQTHACRKAQSASDPSSYSIWSTSTVSGF